jgi:flagellar M-ring protein FliF
VQSVRIHLVMPEKSVFISRAEPASASIVLRLRSGRTLGASEVAGIVHLTAASVPGLTPDRVAVVTTEGEMLKKPRAAAGADGSSTELDEEHGLAQHAVEVQLEDRARAMLERVVGPGHVDVRVTAEIDPARIEHAEDHYDPAKSTLRSEEVSVDRNSGALDDSVAGVPGAESNLPTGGALGAAAAALAAAAGAAGDAGAGKTPAGAKVAAGAVRESHTRNYEVDHVSERRTVNPGTLKRIAVAVVLDGVPQMENGKLVVLPRSHEELEKLTLLVRSAVGANDFRGDMVTVDSIPFDAAKNALDAVPASVETPHAIKTWRAYLPVGIGAAVLVLLLVGGIIVTRRRSSKVLEAATQFLPPAVVAQQLGTSNPTIDVRAAAIERAAADPATAALVLRAWLGTMDADTKVPAAKS